MFKHIKIILSQYECNKSSGCLYSMVIISMIISSSITMSLLLRLCLLLPVLLLLCLLILIIMIMPMSYEFKDLKY